MITFVLALLRRFNEWVHKDRSLGFGADKGDLHHMSVSWIREQKRDTSRTW